MGQVKLKSTRSDAVDYQIDWTNWLATGETVSASVWTVPTGLVEESTDFDDTTSTVMLSGGTAGVTYKVPCVITTDQGRARERSIIIRVEDR